jgi:hypothetical protein
MRITLTALTARKQDGCLIMFIDLADDLTGLKIARHSTQRHFEDDVLAAFAEAECAAAPLAVVCEYMLAILQVKQGPELFIAFQDQVTAATAITTIRSTFADELFSVEMRASRATMSRTTEYLYVVYEIFQNVNLSGTMCLYA